VPQRIVSESVVNDSSVVPGAFGGIDGVGGDVARQKAALRTKGLSIGLAVAPFGIAFGVLCGQTGLAVWQAVGFSALVFTGASQFAAVTVLNDGGSATTAIVTALLLGLRSLAYGVLMAPSMSVQRWKRALESHLMIDESMAIGTAAPDSSLVRYGYLCGGIGVFVLWNISTLIGAVIGGGADATLLKFGVDVAVPASFVVLVWPRLMDPKQRPIAILGALITVALIPVAPAGVPILASGLAALLIFRARDNGRAESSVV
jgi:4-azaleucine resistance transporter AzlC